MSQVYAEPIDSTNSLRNSETKLSGWALALIGAYF
jgi:hypothetical protein